MPTSTMKVSREGEAPSGALCRLFTGENGHGPGSRRLFDAVRGRC